MLPSEPVVASGGCWLPQLVPVLSPDVLTLYHMHLAHVLRFHSIASSLYLCLGTRSCPLFVTPWTVAHLASLSIGFSRQEYGCRLPFPPPGDLPDPGVEPMSLVSPALQADSLPAEPLHAPISLLASWTAHSLTNETNSKSLCESFGSVHKRYSSLWLWMFHPGISKLGYISGNHLGSFKND